MSSSRSGARPARRADAQQNAEKILSAATACLSRNPDVSVSEIAQQAGVGRVTLYGHFPSREALVEATLKRVLSDGDRALAALDLTGPPRAALRALVTSSWLLTAQASAVLAAAQATLPPGRVQELHGKAEERVGDLIRRGQDEGAFRSDLPASWLAGVLHHVMKGAATDVATGRLEPSDAPGFLAATVLAAFTPVEDATLDGELRAEGK